jgi:hypothetical protein
MTFSLLEINEKRTFSSPHQIQAQDSKKIALPSSRLYIMERGDSTPR